MRWRVAAVGALVLAGCQRTGGEGDLLVHWHPSIDSVSRAQLLAPGRANWCEDAGLLAVMALGNDTGFAFVLYPEGIPAPGEYPVRPPSDTLTRPRVALALRLLGLNQVKGFYGTSGTVRIREADRMLSGDIEAHLKGLQGMELELDGGFRRLSITSDTAGCPPPRASPPAPAPAPADTSLR